MSGHSKWSTIKHKKAAADAKRGKVFSQLSKNIRIAVKAGGGDPNKNSNLRLAIEKAKAANMPKNNIKRAIERASGIGKAGGLDEIVYEGYGPAGVGLIIVAVTDNKMRTSSQIRGVLSKYQGSLGGPGSAMYLFSRSGADYQVKIPANVDEAERQKIQKLIDSLEELDDVEEVYSNLVM